MAAEELPNGGRSGRLVAVVAGLLGMTLSGCAAPPPATVRLGRPVIESPVVAAIPDGGSADDLALAISPVPPVPTTVAPSVPVPPAPPLASVSPVPVERGAVAAPEGELTVGTASAAVLALEQRLDALRYDTAVVDGVFDRVTAHAVMAFQKVNGLPRTGRATDGLVAAVAAATGIPAALAPEGGPDRVEVDLARQVLFLYRGGSLAKILPVSTGSGRRFCSQGFCRRAVTPTGAYRVYRQGPRAERGPLGVLYRPQYFNGGIAIHGAHSVPGSPASHGCVRIPMNASVWFPGQVAVGTPVFVF